ncbi:EVE domain-containing protein [Saprospiraceae bacterium]|jgi:5-methylcytosine-specific restriction protein B|nr:EVE domain-containing protein [Saprospiraceae bacterium]
MGNKLSINYWLFQSNPNKFKLREALQQEALKTFIVKAHKGKIKKGDKVIIWETGAEAGCYALATVASNVENDQAEQQEVPFFKGVPEKSKRVHLSIDYNLWSNPITKDLVPLSKSFDRFFKGLSGTNYKATKKQFTEIINFVVQQGGAKEQLKGYDPKTSLNHPLNLILYGAPGTGKTYQTINYALSIIENRTMEELEKEPREELRHRFNEYMEEGWIQYVTFHPSLGYEDFVEGIKPNTTQQGNLLYEVEDGVFKYISLTAKRHLVEVLLSLIPVQEVKIDYEALYSSFLLYLESEDFNSFGSRTGKRMLLQKMARNGNLTVRPENSFLAYTIFKTKLKKLYKTFQSIDDIKHTQNDINLLLGGVNTRAYWSVFNELKKFEPSFVQALMEEDQEDVQLPEEGIDAFELSNLSEVAKNRANKFVLIIDEIDRGNAAEIFGDVITLIEEDKRESNPEALKIVLPFSKTYFCVPPNLHIIGTMNTADKSVDSLDSAFRRRFTFVEQKPNLELFNQELIAGVDLKSMLAKINQRISILLDDNHLIGHSYFLQVKNIAELKSVFANKIIPLLQEYFFEDYGKIGLILGEDFLKEKKLASSDFASFEYEHMEELLNQKIYQVRDMEELDAISFIGIYK